MGTGATAQLAVSDMCFCDGAVKQQNAGVSCTPCCWLLVPPWLDSIDAIHGSQALQVIQQRVQLHLQTSNREHEGMGLSYDRVPSSSAAATALPAPDLVVLRILRGLRSLLAVTPLSPALLAPLFRRHSG